MNRRSFLLIILSLFVCNLVLRSHKETTPSGVISAQVQRVVSGQTLEVLLTETNSPQQLRVRLVGLTAPDLSQDPWGPQAQTTLASWLEDGTIHLEWDRQLQDPLGRYLAYVWKDGVFINEQLLMQGYVLLDSRGPKSKYQERLEQAQHYARIMGYGIWNEDNPLRITPQAARQHD